MNDINEYNYELFLGLHIYKYNTNTKTNTKTILFTILKSVHEKRSSFVGASRSQNYNFLFWNILLAITSN